MSNLTIVIKQECESVNYTMAKNVEGSKGKTWTVTAGHYDRFRNVCSCPAFYFHGKGKGCKHIDKVLSEICNWHQKNGISQSKEQKEKHICPKCGEQTVYVSVGV